MEHYRESYSLCSCHHQKYSDRKRPNLCQLGLPTHQISPYTHDGFNIYLNRIIAYAGRLVQHFSRSTVATLALRDKQVQMKFSHHLIQSCKTRWNMASDISKMNTGSCVKVLKCDRSTKSEVSISNIHQMAFGFLQSQFMRIEERSGLGIQNKSA